MDETQAATSGVVATCVLVLHLMFRYRVEIGALITTVVAAVVRGVKRGEAQAEAGDEQDESPDAI